MDNAPLILLAAGGTGGHLFPAEALAVELIRRGLRVRLATDGRALRYSGLFGKESIELVPSATVRSRNPISLAQTVLMLGYGTLVAANVMRRLKPAAVVGFGGYPTLPPLVAARMLGSSTRLVANYHTKNGHFWEKSCNMVVRVFAFAFELVSDPLLLHSPTLRRRHVRAVVPSYFPSRKVLTGKT